MMLQVPCPALDSAEAENGQNQSQDSDERILTEIMNQVQQASDLARLEPDDGALVGIAIAPDFQGTPDFAACSAAP